MSNKLHRERRSKSDDIGTDHDIAGIELPDRYMRRDGYNVIDCRPAFAEKGQEAT